MKTNRIASIMME